MINKLKPIFEQITEPVIIACSGGSDSVFLAYALKTFSPNLKHHIIYCNHQLRPEENLNEINLIKQIGKQLNFNSHIIDLSINKGNQDKYRKERLTNLTNWAHKHNIKTILLGHHLNDDLETLIMQLIRGANTNLRGIPKETNYNNIQLQHPLLSFAKEDILNYLKSENIQYLNDSSNQSLKYERNRIRQIISQIKNEDTFKASQTEKSLQYLKHNEESMINKSDRIKEELFKINEIYLIKKERLKHIDHNEFILKTLLENHFNSPVNSTEINQIINAFKSNHLTKIILKECSVEMDYKWILIKKKNATIPDLYNDFRQNFGIQNMASGFFCITNWTESIKSTKSLLAISNDDLSTLTLSSVYASRTKINGLKKEFRAANISVIDQYFHPAFFIHNKLIWIPGVYTEKNEGCVIISFKKL